MATTVYVNGFDSEWPGRKLSYNIIVFANMLLCFAIIKTKGSQDILQGLNKLDYLLKVSVFQVYKQQDLEDAKEDIDLVFT